MSYREAHPADTEPLDDERESGRYEIPTPDPGDYGNPDRRNVLEKVADAIKGGPDPDRNDSALDRKV